MDSKLQTIEAAKDFLKKAVAEQRRKEDGVVSDLRDIPEDEAARIKA